MFYASICEFEKKNCNRSHYVNDQADGRIDGTTGGRRHLGPPSVRRSGAKHGEPAMTDKTGAWVWSHYKAVVTDAAENAAGSQHPSAADANVIPFQRVREESQDAGGRASVARRMKFGAALGVATLAGLFFPTIGVLLLVFGALLVASSREPAKTAALLAAAPGGSFANKYLAQFDKWLG